MTPKNRLSIDTVLSAVTDQVSAEMSDEVVVLSLRSGTYFGLNSVAASVWNLLQEPRSIAELVGALTEEFEISREECAVEVVDLLTELLDLELVQIHAA